MKLYKNDKKQVNKANKLLKSGKYAILFNNPCYATLYKKAYSYEEEEKHTAQGMLLVPIVFVMIVIVTQFFM